ncbi:S-layer homology domain-containing protein [Bacillus sp. 3255]|uniref:S-layer homology domain-containing protein n=1 Tax=Bacillus sp. 3255 TaxID=2817904 RepID=UPI002858033C|nr:S-layer homology domain-containing protein [Bacillus sp. 3255]MDR6884968.1 hypothetical protein [Bacillus sp. 3255]
MAVLVASLCSFNHVFAAVPSTMLASIAPQKQGDMFVVQGTTSLEEVVVLILRPNETMLEMDQLSKEQLRAGKTVTLPADSPAGTYTVKAGAGRDWAETAFEVAAKDRPEEPGPGSEPGPGPGPGGGEAGGGEAGGGNGGNGSNGSSGSSGGGNNGNNNGNNGSHGSGEATSPSAGGTVKLAVLPAGKPDASGLARAAVGQAEIQSAYDEAGKASSSPKVILEVQHTEGASGYEITLPVSFLTAGVPGSKLEIRTETGRLLLAGGMFKPDEAAGVKQVTFTITLASKDALPEKVKSAIGGRPLIDVSVMLDGHPVAWSNPDAPAVISIPYDAAPAELSNPDGITVWHIDSKGNAAPVTSGNYDAETDTVTFKTPHFSQYAVVYAVKSFSDLSGYPWAKKQVEALAAKGIVTGVTDDAFVPEAAVKRADFVLLLVRTLGLYASFEENFNDIHPDDYYYEALGIARKLGIADGSGKNLFQPDKDISRQEMMALTARALGLANKPQGSGTAASAAPFKDADQVSAYAAAAVQALLASGYIEGSGGFLHPQRSTSRAEAAVMLYRIYSQTRGL